MSEIKDIKNVTLTTSFQEVTVATSLLFSGYIVKTNDKSDFEIKLLTGDTETFICSLEDNTSPLLVNKLRNYPGESTTLFWVKGTAGSILQIMFTRE